ncbi:MAG: NVEALA domain-containing protein [Tannerella sp.]|jgi:hypothetical protein|nr:NVEALA domain-containing protein [Tannerella sp.]
MNKKFLLAAVVAAVVSVSAWNIKQNVSSEPALSEMALANVEALATEYTWYQNRADFYDPARHCYQQCVLNGTGCAYMHDFPYNC